MAQQNDCLQLCRRGETNWKRRSTQTKEKASARSLIDHLRDTIAPEVLAPSCTRATRKGGDNRPAVLACSTHVAPARPTFAGPHRPSSLRIVRVSRGAVSWSDCRGSQTLSLISPTKALSPSLPLSPSLSPANLARQRDRSTRRHSETLSLYDRLVWRRELIKRRVVNRKYKFRFFINYRCLLPIT